MYGPIDDGTPVWFIDAECNETELSLDDCKHYILWSGNLSPLPKRFNLYCEDGKFAQLLSPSLSLSLSPPSPSNIKRSGRVGVSNVHAE